MLYASLIPYLCQEVIFENASDAQSHWRKSDQVLNHIGKRQKIKLEKKNLTEKKSHCILEEKINI